MDINEAVAVLNERKWRGRDNWMLDDEEATGCLQGVTSEGDTDTDTGAADHYPLYLDIEDAIAIATGLVAVDRCVELERENAELHAAVRIKQ